MDNRIFEKLSPKEKQQLRDQYSNVIESLQVENQRFITQVTKLTQENKSKDQQITSLEQINRQIAEENQQLVLLKTENTNLNSEDAKHNPQIESFRKEMGSSDRVKIAETFSYLQYKFAAMESENARLKQEKEESIQVKKVQEVEFSNLRRKFETLAQENEALALRIQKFNIDEKKQILQYRESRTTEDNFKEYYDCRIRADSFHTLLLGGSWPIEYRDYKQYLELREQNAAKVAVLGYENTGKSWILSKLTGSELPQGMLTKTTGICIKFPTDMSFPWIALDTPGTNVSIKTQQMKERMAKLFEDKRFTEEDQMRILLGDNILIESMLQHFVVSHAQVLLVVIGKLRRDNQRLINRIKSLSGKRIIIVHNLLETREKEDAEKVIQEDIVETFRVTEKIIYVEKNNDDRINQKVYLESDDKSEKAIEHVIMAHEGSPAGAYYNESAISYMKAIITSIPVVKAFDLTEAFFNHLNDYFKIYLSSKTADKGNPFILEKDENQTLKEIKLKGCSDYELKWSSADEFGQIKTFVREGLDEIPYTVKIIEKPSDVSSHKALRVEFEMSGICNDAQTKARIHRLTGNQIRVEIKGKSEDNTKRGEQEELQENTRRFGDFNILTEPINLGGYVIHDSEPFHKISDEVSGLKIISWNLHPRADDQW